MSPSEFHYFVKLPPEIRNLVWLDALGDSACLHVLYGPRRFFNNRSRRAHHFRIDVIDAVFDEHTYCQPGQGKHISTKHRIFPEHNLRLVNKEASGVVRDAYKGLEARPRGGVALALNSNQIAVDYRKDMVFLIGGDIEMRNRDLYIIPQLHPENNIDILHNLRHLALRLFDIAQWPASGISSWYRRGLEGLLQSASQLETFYIVVDRVFSGADFDPDYDTTATATAANNAERSQQLVRSPSELLDVLKSLPRDRYGFSDYDAFAAKTKLDILAPKLCSPAPYYRSVVMDFKEYDALIKRVQNQVRPYVSPPAQQGRKVDFRVVVDLDSNMNGGGMGLVPRMVKVTLGKDDDGVERLVQGYDRYFARPAAWDWWADVSGYEPPKKEKEAESESEYLPDGDTENDSDEDS